MSVSGQNRADWVLGKQQEESLLLHTAAKRADQLRFLQLEATLGDHGKQCGTRLLTPSAPRHSPRWAMCRAARRMRARGPGCHRPRRPLPASLSQGDAAGMLWVCDFMKSQTESTVTVLNACSWGPNAALEHTWIYLELKSWTRDSDLRMHIIYFSHPNASFFNPIS